MCAKSQPIFNQSDNLPLLTVQLVNADFTLLCTGILLTPNLIIVSGSCIEFYENSTVCEGLLVKFQGLYYNIEKCEIRVETRNENDTNYGRDHYNDIGVIFVSHFTNFRKQHSTLLYLNQYFFH